MARAHTLDHDFRDAKGRKLTGGRLHNAVVKEARESYDQLLAAQGGVCALCGTPPKNRRLNIDHDHVTLEVRGLLCHRCNRFVLPSWMTPALLRRAADYLEGEW